MRAAFLFTVFPIVRLPKVNRSRKVDTLKALGVKVETNMVIGRVISIDELMDDMGFEASIYQFRCRSSEFMKIRARTFAAFIRK